VTNDIARRAWEHREGIGSAFTKRYGLTRLVHIEAFEAVTDAIHREKRLKHWNRAWKIKLIEAGHPHWEDRYFLLN
jgi:putative endonuclease